MRPYCFVIFTLFLAIFFPSGISSSYGQVVNESQNFPAYKDIRPVNGEIVDHSDSGLVVSKPNLFGYPVRTVIYILNGKPTMNVERVKKIIYEKNIRIENVVITNADRYGKRKIYITYEVL